MSNPFIATLQNKIFVKEKPGIFKKLQINWWLNHGDEKKVVQNLLQYLKKEAINQAQYLNEAHQLIDYGVFQETRDYLTEAVNYCHNVQDRARAYYLLARCAYGIGAVKEALSYLDCALENQPNCSDFWNLQADCLLELGFWEEAVASLNKSLRSSPGDAETIYRLGSIYVFHQEYGEALNCFSGCCKLKPYNSDYWEMKAEMLIKLDQIHSAAECLRKAIRFNAHLHLSTRLAYCYAKTGEIKKAKKLLLNVLKQQPDDFDALCNLAGIYHKLSNDEQAYKLLKKAYNINCNDYLLLNNLGYICFKLGRTRKALEYYHKALKINSSDTIVLYNLSVCLYHKGLWEEARTTLEKLLATDNYSTEAWALLGNVYEQLSKHTLAADCFNKSLGLAQ